MLRRAAEHLKDKGIQIEELIGGLTRSDARAVEQALIDTHGLNNILNKINSISPSRVDFPGLLQRGYNILKGVK